MDASDSRVSFVVRGCSANPAPFVEKALPFPFNYFYIFVTNRVSIFLFWFLFMEIILPDHNLGLEMLMSTAAVTSGLLRGSLCLMDYGFPQCGNQVLCGKM